MEIRATDTLTLADLLRIQQVAEAHPTRVHVIETVDGPVYMVPCLAAKRLPRKLKLDLFGRR